MNETEYAVTVIDPVVEAAAEAYLGQPLNFGHTNHLLNMLEHDAFVAGVEWARTHGEQS